MNARWMNALAVSAVLGLPAAALAQGAQQQSPQQQQQQQAQQEARQQRQQQAQQPGQAQTFQGTIDEIDLADGDFTVKNAEESREFNADPRFLAQHNVGDSVTVQYQNYGGELWVEPQAAAGQGTAQPQQMAQTQTATGKLSKIERSDGEIKIGGEEYRVHPDKLKNVQPGQSVSVTYTTVGEKKWVEDIQPQQGSQQQQQQPAQPPPDLKRPENSGESGY